MKRQNVFLTLLRLPDIADPVERRAARLLQTTMLAGLAALSLHVFALLTTLGPERAGSALTTSLTSIMLALGVLLILRQGHVRLAAQIAVFGIGFALSIGVYFGRGVTGTGFSAFVTLVVASGLLLSTRTAFITATLAAAFGAFLLIDEHLHGVTPERFKSTVLSYAGNVSIFFATAAMVGFTVSRLKRDTELSLRNQEATRVAEEKLALALDASSLGTWEWNIGTGELTWGPKTAEIFGISLELFGGTYEAYFSLVHPEDRDTLKASIAEALTTPDAHYRVTHRVIRPSGDLAWVRAYGRVIRRQDGTPIRMVGTAANVTNRIQEEQLERGTESTFRSVMASLPVGVMLQGPATEIIYANDASLELLGIRERRPGRYLDAEWDAIHEDGSPFPPEAHPATLAAATRKPQRGAVMGVRRPGRQDRVWLEADAIPQMAPSGEVERIICTFSDVTESTQSKVDAALNQEKYTELLETERKYSQVFDHAADAIFLIGPANKFIDANAAACSMLGYAKEELLGMGPAQIIAPESIAARPLDLTLIQAETFRVERVLVCRDQRRITAEVNARRINDRLILALVRDISHRSNPEMLEEQERYKSIVESSPDGVAVHQDGIVVYANREMMRILRARERSEIVGRPVMEFVTPGNADLVRQRISGIVDRGQNAPMIREQFIALDGKHVDVEVGGSPVTFNGKPAVQVVVRDLARTRRAEIMLHHSEQRWQLIAENVPDFIVLLDEGGHILFLNHVLPGWRKEDVLGQSVTRFQPPEWHERVLDMVGRVFRDGASFEYESTGSGSPGEERSYVTRLVPIRDPEGGIASALMVATDITARKRDVARLEYQATHDSLTDLPNRQSLIEKSLGAIERAEKTGKQCALLLIDLDRFKEINDTLGHYTGDLLLKRIGPRLHSFLKTTNAELARLGGDEFAILVPSINEAAEAEGIAQSVHHLIREPFQLEGMNLELDSSIGISLYPMHGRDPIALLRCADVAMYIAKKRATGTALYSPEQDRYSRRRLSLLTELGLAIREDQMHIEYQPKFQLPGQTCVGMEALVRWSHPTHGAVSPGEFIPLAEMGNLIIPLTHWVLDTVMRQIQAWAAQGIETKVAVNLSVRSLMDEHWPITVDAMLRHYRIRRNLLEFEITESAIMADPERALVVLNRLHSLGIALSIDDFGTGYSSLSYLSRLPIDALKIDRSFVLQMRENERNIVIVNSTIRLAHTLGIHVIAEGVEDAHTLETLIDMKCDQAQGFLLARPAPPAQAVTYLKKE